MAKAVDFAGFKSELRRRIEEAVTFTANHAAGIAQAEAPVRKIFKGSRRSLRQLDPGELKAEQTARRHLFGANAVGPISIERERQTFRGGFPQASKGVKQGNQRGFPRAVPTNPLLRAPGRRSIINSIAPQLPGIVHDTDKNLRRITTIGGISVVTNVNPDRLSARGRWEVLHAQARNSITTHAGQQIVGGSLRKSIKVGELYSRGSYIHISVAAEIYYAKYVEFGTRHAAGQPFLRPALAKVREQYRSRIYQAIQQSTRKVGANARPEGDQPGGIPIGSARIVGALRKIPESEGIE
jgi:HK97 gp10 family phage protein